MEEEERAKTLKLWGVILFWVFCCCRWLFGLVGGFFFFLPITGQNSLAKAQIPAIVLVIISVWDPDSGVSDCPEPSPELHRECFSWSAMQIWPLCLELTALLREAVKCEAVHPCCKLKTE